MSEPISRDSVVDLLVHRLQDDVLDGTYPPGSYLPPERELASAYGVTRTSLKHALVRLAGTGLVQTRHGVGTQVCDYERRGGSDLLPLLARSGARGWRAEIFEARTGIGTLVAARAATRRSPEQIQQLRELLTRVRDAADADAAQRVECDIHRVLAAASGNRVYRLLINTVLDAYLPIRGLLRRPFRDPPAAAARLSPLIEAVAAGDEDATRQAAQDYLDRTGQLMLDERR